ncbi:MAG: hypothetical protein GKR94_15005 [Gammaproteobacteria bacterium]|nr:hypothetical protein [Gammaproteobacteria bacterium]
MRCSCRHCHGDVGGDGLERTPCGGIAAGGTATVCGQLRDKAVDNKASALRTGGCDCGAVRYQVKSKLRGVIACHCVQCRKPSGHYSAATAAPPPALQLLEVRALMWYRASPAAARGFCGTCDSTLFWRPATGARISE